MGVKAYFLLKGFFLQIFNSFGIFVPLFVCIGGTSYTNHNNFYSNTREFVQDVLGQDPRSSRKDQEANMWGRNGGDPNKYRPNGLPSNY